MALKKSILVQLVWKIHPLLYRWSGGRIGGQTMNMPVLLLTTRGRKSGRARTKALMYLPANDDFVVVASYLGEPRHPDWWLNLRANPNAEVQIGGRSVRVVAREAEGEERAELWQKVVARQPDYAEYQQRTQRNIPVVVLEPR
jgi:deazaflavin-dependent oxidoreductase (nitroreductase family)